MPWYFIQTDGRSTTCFGLKTGCNTIGHWNIGDGHMQLTLNTQSGGVGVRLGDRELFCAEVIGTRGTQGEGVYDTGRRFCKLLCDTPRLPKKPVYGINDWYYAYGNNSAKLILEQTSLFSDLITHTDNKPFSVVDAGWAAYSPLLPGDCCWQDDFSRPNEKFPDMHSLAMDIGKLGMRPGLWTRPLSAAHDTAPNRLLPSIPGRDDPKRPILDPTIPENIAHVKKNIDIYRQWGFHLVKHDYTTFDLFGRWGFEMTDDLTPPGWRFNDISRTSAEVIKDLYLSIRGAAGDMYLLGCNTMSHLSAGVFEINRIGDDTSGREWARTRKMGVNALGFRLLQNNSFYAADGDCVGLTADIPWQKNRQWMQLLAGSGTPLFISAQPDAMGQGQRDYIRQSFASAAGRLPVAEPLDWLTQQWPQRWRLDGAVVNFDWS